MPKCEKLGHFAKCQTKIKSNQQSVNQVENNLLNDESDDEVYIFSMAHKSADKTYPINIDSKNIKHVHRQWLIIEYIRRKNVQYFRPFTNIKTI